MRITEVEYRGELPVDGYGPGFWRVGGRVIDGAVLVGPGGVAPWDGEVEALLALKGAVDVIFLGMGAVIAPVPRALREALEEAGIGAEPMASPTAARSYNVCLGEGRRVAAALLPVPPK
ncbi:Mth938-like domain-containing protein [Vannielia sp.]|uniref:Mth938-like domain-containing protein n=1 Tax=Vannielia sp. TaxID=2813045 RepID=UPI00262F692E|nr:Mth938-like domain-containing protein [Vannielia sp.]MDF1873427.1 Mth938-like domain-containing protein [Vannielia sp.]